MAQIVTFPGLGLEFELNRIAFYMPRFLGGFGIYWYGVIIAFGFLSAILYAMKNTRRFGLDGERSFDVILLSVLAGIVGARLYYVLFTWENYNSLRDVIDTRDGGLAIYGGVIFGITAGVVLCKLRKIRMLPMLDLISGSLFLGQAIGRWGNFVNVEAFGSNTSLPWGMAGPSITSYLANNGESLRELGVNVDFSAPVHPTFFYESLWCLLGFSLIVYLTNRRRFDGQLALIYAFWYGLGRFFIEGLRTDSLLLGNVRISQMVALI